MNNKKTQKNINQISNTKHKKQFWQQILLPIFGFIAIIALLWIVFSLTDSGNYSSWSSLSIIFLSIFILLFCLIIITALIFMVIGMDKLLKFIPEKTFIIQTWLQSFSNSIKKFSNKITSPLISTKSWLLTINLKNFYKKDKNKNE